MGKNDLVRLTTQDVSSAIPVTDSDVIAERTNRSRENIQRLILKYMKSLLEFGEVGTEIRPSKNNQMTKVYLLTEEQATFLITLMRNTPEVLLFKIKLVKAFSFMKNELLARVQTRAIGKTVRHSLTDSIKNNTDEGTTFKKFAFSNYSKLVYKKVLGMQVSKAKEARGLKQTDNLRDFLTVEELEKVQALESKIAGYIEMRKDISGDDKLIYEEVKKFIEK